MQNSTPPATSNISPLQELWEKEYENSSTPFDIEEPDAWIAALAKSGKIHGEVLDAGCGPGRNSIYLAGLGCNMLGVDISAHAVGRARQKASSKNSSARFLQANLCQLSGYEDHFDAVVDIGCFHSLDQRDRAAYAAALHRYCREGAVIYLRAFRWAHPGGSSAAALIEQDIRTAFSNNGWIVKELVERKIELYISETEKPITPCWFAEMSYEPLALMSDPPHQAGFAGI
jgi:cyclopropane fatty-acyl-phospholipid synthase-like methyltransferase